MFRQEQICLEEDWGKTRKIKKKQKKKERERERENEKKEIIFKNTNVGFIWFKITEYAF